MTPIIVEELSTTPGPAQAAGVKAGWYLDLVKTFSGQSREQLAQILDGIGGIKFDSPPQGPKVLEAAMSNLDEFLSRLNQKVRALDSATLFFLDSSAQSQPILLPEVRVAYDASAKLNSDIKVLDKHSDGTKAIVKSLDDKGPAQAAGVRPGWAVDWATTLMLNEQVEPKLPSEEDFLAAPEALLERSGIALAFENLQPTKQKLFAACGPSGGPGWKSVEVMGDYCEFEFMSDGDGASYPDTRWGFWALVSAKPAPNKDEEKKKSASEPFTVEVEKKPESMLGISVKDVDQAIVITSIYEGILQDWNTAHPDEGPIKEGTMIIEVNGIKDLAEMNSELTVFKKHTMVMQNPKETGPSCTAGHILTLNPRPHNRCDVCSCSGTQYRCPSGCDYDMCQNCYTSATSGPIVCPVKDLDGLSRSWTEVCMRGEGNSDQPQVERQSWDEQRLRALCARHGWDFEWMTEDGERRRRANERLTEWRLEESMVALLHDEAPAVTPDGVTVQQQ